MKFSVTAKYALVIVLAFSFQGCGRGPYLNVNGKTYNCEEWIDLEKLKMSQELAQVKKNSPYVGGKALVLIPPRYRDMMPPRYRNMMLSDREMNCFADMKDEIKTFPFVDTVKKGEFFDSVIMSREFSAIESEKPDYVIDLREITSPNQHSGHVRIAYVWYPANNDRNKIPLVIEDEKRGVDRWNSFNDSLSKTLILLSGCVGAGPTTGHHYPECNATYCVSVTAEAKSIVVGAAVGAAIQEDLRADEQAFQCYLQNAVTERQAVFYLRKDYINARNQSYVGFSQAPISISPYQRDSSESRAIGNCYAQRLQEFRHNFDSEHADLDFLGRSVGLKVDEFYKNSLKRYQNYLKDTATQRQAALSLRQDTIDARNCYDQKWKEVIAQFDNGVISKDEAEKRLKEIQAGLGQVKQMVAEARASLSIQREQTRRIMQAELRLLKVISEDTPQSMIVLNVSQPQGAKILAKIFTYAGKSQKLDAQVLEQQAMIGDGSPISEGNHQIFEEMKTTVTKAWQQLDEQQQAEIKADIKALQEMDIQQRQQQITQIDQQLDSHFTEQGHALSDLSNADKDRKIKPTERMKRELPQSAQSQPKAGQNQRQETAARASNSPVKNKQMDSQDVQHLRMISKIEKQVESHFEQAEKNLSDLYDADKDKEARRQQERSARALEF